MKKAIEAVADKNHENFKNAVTKYKTYTNFDKWKINVFKQIMDSLEVKVNPEDFLGESKKEENQINEDDPKNFI